ncbi:hypothetical protein ElyMa_005680800 [Elysia marginata]|uniref:C2H2-type domain-containing protein n=1 Tax=Elysia marginata TaxID=1093978 RepID=A0AAV4FEN7_9GAST|nr:hypothetical protein ElyMa_005680800 [Elysia marginata]
MQKSYSGALDDSIPPTHQHQCYTSAFHHKSGFKPCSTTHCKTCPYTSCTSSFKSFTNGRVFKITLNLSCHSHNIIYLITCTKCSKQFNGEKNSLRTRFTSHRFDINND